MATIHHTSTIPTDEQTDGQIRVVEGLSRFALRASRSKNKKLSYRLENTASAACISFHRCYS